MARRALPAALVFAGLIADLTGRHGWALALLLLAIPAAFALALACYGDALEARCSGMRPLFAGLAAILVLLSAALRSPAVVGGVPHLAVSSAGFALAFYAAVAATALLEASPLRAIERLAPEGRPRAAERAISFE